MGHMADDAGYKSDLERYHITLLIVVMAVPFIELPYVIVSRVEYDWLHFSRNILAGLSLLLGAALWDRCRRKPEPPKEE
jgi:hypothetical protein